jgi:hypothetical protein
LRAIVEAIARDDLVDVIFDKERNRVTAGANLTTFLQEMLRTFPALADRQFFVLDESSTPARVANRIVETLHSRDDHE